MWRYKLVQLSTAQAPCVPSATLVRRTSKSIPLSFGDFTNSKKIVKDSLANEVQLKNSLSCFSIASNANEIQKRSYSIMSKYRALRQESLQKLETPKVQEQSTNQNETNQMIKETKPEKKEFIESSVLPKGEIMGVPSDASKFIPMDTYDVKQPFEPRSLQVAMVGAPNAGKSTLVNAIIGDKVSIVSNKSQTTREQTIGIFSQENNQVVFLDTPGIVPLKDAKQIQRVIVTAAWDTIHESDLVLFIMDAAKGLDMHVKEIVPQLHSLLTEISEKNPERKKEILLILNKCDLIETKQELRSLVDQVVQMSPFFTEHFYVSALSGTGVQDLKDYLNFRTVPREWSYNPTKTTVVPEVKIITEAIREQIYKALYKELPYLVKQETYGWTELSNGDLRIDQVLFVQKESQKKIIIGKGGAVIQEIRRNAMAEIKNKLNRDVQLFISVKVRKNQQ